MFIWLSVLTGVIYPLFITGIAHLTMKHKATGGMIKVKDEIVGARLISQKFEKESYFWPRPSFVDYNPLPSGGSNLGPTSKTLQDQVEERKNRIMKVHELKEPSTIPSELLFASGSGLDPHISLEAVHFQEERILKARGWQEPERREALIKLIDQATTWPFLGILGRPYVNVLMLNVSLDEYEKLL